MDEKEELAIYRNLLINLHTARWCGNNDRVIKILDAIGSYSYARTNSNGDDEREEKQQLKTLRNLENI